MAQTTDIASSRMGVSARLHPLKSKTGKQLYSVIFRGKLLIEHSCDPECDAARALLLQGISGKLHVSDAGGFSITKKREAWGVRYLYTPRPPMLRTIIDIDKAATLRSVETGNAPRFRRNRHVQRAHRRLKRTREMHR